MSSLATKSQEADRGPPAGRPERPSTVSRTREHEGDIVHSWAIKYVYNRTSGRGTVGGKDVN